MKLTPRKLNTFLIIKLPSAYVCGVRAIHLDDTSCKVKVKHNWFNKNPFKSLFWAVQGMAAELTTGAMVMKKIKESGKDISMLVANNKGDFTKKATGRIVFCCNEGQLIDEAIKKAVQTGEGQTVWLHSVGKNSEGQEVSNFDFEWTLKLRSRAS